MMFSFTKKFTIAVLVFCSVQFGAFGSNKHDMRDEKPMQRAVMAVTVRSSGGLQDALLPEVMKIIFEEASKNGDDPRDLECVCKNWYNVMRYQISVNGPPALDKAGIPYTTQLNDFFMEDCMRRFRENIISRAILIYKKGESDERQIKFSDFKDGTADLSGCGGEKDKQVYTTSIKRFREVNGANKGRFVTFIGPYHMAHNLLPPNAEKSSMVILWRCGNWTAYFDYLSGFSIDELSKYNLFRYLEEVGGSENQCDGAAVYDFHVCLNQN